MRPAPDTNLTSSECWVLGIDESHTGTVLGMCHSYNLISSSLSSPIFVNVFSIHQHACPYNSKYFHLHRKQCVGTAVGGWISAMVQDYKKYPIKQNYEEEADNYERTGNIFASFQNIADKRVKLPIMGTP